jgi:hypothetical protein
MEYMSLAKPIVAFDLTEHRFTAQGAAAYVKPNDELEFARTIAGLMDDPARRKELGLLGRHRMENELAWQYSIPKLLHVYQAVLPIPAGSPEALRFEGGIEIQPRRKPRPRAASCEAGDPS